MRRRDDPGVDAAVMVAMACVGTSGALIPLPDSGGVPVGRLPTSAESRLPGNVSALYAYLGLAEVARRLEVSLLNQVRGQRTRTRRGGSEGNTLAALRSVALLAHQLEYGDAARVAEILYREATRTQVLRAVDTAVRWVPIRACGCAERQGCGHRPPVCPYCRTLSLRRQEGAYVIMCQGYQRTETGSVPCTDGDGNRPRATLDYSKVTGEAVLVFGDGLVLGAVGSVV